MVDSNFFDLSATAIGRAPQASRNTGFSVASGMSGLDIRVTEPGFHTITIQAVSGREVSRRQGYGPAAYRFEKTLLPGLYFVRVNLNGQSQVRKVFVGN